MIELAYQVVTDFSKLEVSLLHFRLSWNRYFVLVVTGLLD